MEELDHVPEGEQVWSTLAEALNASAMDELLLLIEKYAAMIADHGGSDAAPRIAHAIRGFERWKEHAIHQWKLRAETMSPPSV